MDLYFISTTTRLVGVNQEPMEMNQRTKPQTQRQGSKKEPKLMPVTGAKPGSKPMKLKQELRGGKPGEGMNAAVGG